MIRAIILDFNGVILDDEPLHFTAMRDAVAEESITVSREEYWGEYLPLDDESCLAAICRNHGHRPTQDRAERILARKRQLYEQMLNRQFPLFPGAREFIHRAAERFPLAIASGARRIEIESTLRATGLADRFRTVVAAEDFVRGKPHPDSYLLALERLNDCLSSPRGAILPRECMVIEDAVGGVHGARAAGMYCVAVTNSYEAEKLSEANRIVGSLADLDVEGLAGLPEGSP
ncbi:MAG: HAD family phosphatase [Acidobacteria bacterium]|nr:HAD family phosphatase [Acidobacteriota bacterium]